MLTLTEAIQKRRSIRRFKPDPVPDELINQMLEAARLATSASNRQPWRCQVIKDQEQKERILGDTTFGARHVLQAPVVIVCGSELYTFVKGHKLAPPGSDYFGAEGDDWESIKEFVPEANLNTAIAVEHMALAGMALGLGTCWAQRLRFGQIAKLLGWPRHLVVFTLLLVGYADEDPEPRPRLALDDIVLKEGQLPQ